MLLPRRSGAVSAWLQHSIKWKTFWAVLYVAGYCLHGDRFFSAQFAVGVHANSVSHFCPETVVNKYLALKTAPSQKYSLTTHNWITRFLTQPAHTHTHTHTHVSRCRLLSKHDWAPLIFECGDQFTHHREMPRRLWRQLRNVLLRLRRELSKVLKTDYVTSLVLEASTWSGKAWVFKLEVQSLKDIRIYLSRWA